MLDGRYADPEAHVFNNQYWIYPTYSAVYNEQTFMDAFSSRDLVTWTKHERVLDVANVAWAKRAVWAPSVIEKDGWFYIKFHHGAQPIDQTVFKDKDGSHYIIYGGWKHCNIARLNNDFTVFIPFPDGTTFREITRTGHMEGAYMFMKDNQYYFMWSEGGWTGPNYAVAYAVGTTPFDPFERVGKILQQDSMVATGAGHHSVLHVPGSANYYIVYHRRPLGETDRNHRVVSIDELRFDANGFIKPVVITRSGVKIDSLRVFAEAKPAAATKR